VQGRRSMDQRQAAEHHRVAGRWPPTHWGARLTFLCNLNTCGASGLCTNCSTDLPTNLCNFSNTCFNSWARTTAGGDMSARHALRTPQRREGAPCRASSSSGLMQSSNAQCSLFPLCRQAKNNAVRCQRDATGMHLMAAVPPPSTRDLPLREIPCCVAPYGGRARRETLPCAHGGSRRVPLLFLWCAARACVRLVCR
jgi:hypothetical protein